MPDIDGPGILDSFSGPAAPGSGTIDDTLVVLGAGVAAPPAPTHHNNVVPMFFRRLQFLRARAGM